MNYSPLLKKIENIENVNEKLSISKQTYRKICFHQEISNAIMKKISNKLNCSVDELIRDENNTKTSDDFEPFVKWVGGKRQLMDEIDKLRPKDFNNYIEPFIGGGAVFCHIKPSNAVINDFNFELITAYKVIKNKPQELMRLLDEYERFHEKKGKEFYLKVREMDREEGFRKKNPVEIAARFIYLNKTGYNGMYRVNSKGYFNVPWNKKNKVKLYDRDNIEAISKFLKKNKVKICCGDFEKVLEEAKPGDFVYLDPPYDLLNDQTFDSYTKDPFGKEGQIRLADACKKLNEKGCMFLLSNHNTDLIKELYKDFNIEVVNAKRMINSNGSKRTGCEEVLIFNYPKEVCNNEQIF